MAHVIIIVITIISKSVEKLFEYRRKIVLDLSTVRCASGLNYDFRISHIIIGPELNNWIIIAYIF